MELRDYWQVVRSRLLMILLIPLIAFLTSTAYVMHKHPIYVANTSLLIGTSVGSGQSPDASTYNGIITSQLFSRMLDKQYDLGVSSTDLTTMIAINFIGDSIMDLSVTSDNAAFSMHLASSAAGTIIQNGPGLIPGLQSARIIDSPTLSLLPLHEGQDIGLATGVGALFAIGFAFLLEYLDLRVKSEEDLQRFLGVRSLGTVREFHFRKGHL